MAEDLSTTTSVTLAQGRPVALRVRRCRLEVLAGPDLGLVRVFEVPTLTVGTSAGCGFRLADRQVSRIHLELRLEPNGYRLRDLGSKNGTFTAGLRVQDVTLTGGADVALGGTLLRFTPLAEFSELQLSDSDRFGELVGRSAVMRRLFAVLERAAGLDSTVLVTGETGTGKELVAEALHQRSARAAQPFVVLDCGAAAPSLMEEALFGHEKGAYTGAGETRAGVFEQANGGTLFLDEIGELPLELQPKLLRAVETRRVQRLGGSSPVEVNVRLVAATHRTLAVEVNRGRFREDLYYRLAVVHLEVPPLRARKEDIPLLVEHLVLQMDNVAMPGADTLRLLMDQPWPGNVRELRNFLERAAVLADLGPPVAGPAGEQLQTRVDLRLPFKRAKQLVIDEFDRVYLDALLAAHGGNITAAARAAGLDRMSVHKILSRLGGRGK